MNETQPKLTQKRIGFLALVLAVVAVIAALLTLALDKSLPYRISSSHYVQYLWAGRLQAISLVTSVVAMVLSVISRRPIPFFLGLLSGVYVLFFTSAMHSGPNPKVWCACNLRSIERAKQEVVKELGLTNGAVVPTEQISKYLTGGPRNLKCAEGGQYIIGTVGADPRCSFHGSMSEIEAGWKQESLNYSGQTGALVTSKNRAD